MLCNFYHKFSSILARNLNRIVDLRQVSFRKLKVKNGTDNLGNLPYIFICHFLLLTYRNLYLSDRLCSGNDLGSSCVIAP